MILLIKDGNLKLLSKVLSFLRILKICQYKIRLIRSKQEMCKYLVLSVKEIISKGNEYYGKNMKRVASN